jgi:hypothetical protein
MVVKNGFAMTHLSPCAKDYLMALQMPFMSKNVACVPDFHAIPSKKVRVKSRGTFSTGLDGNGFIVFANHCNSSNCTHIGASSATLASSTAVPIIVPAGAGVLNFSQTKLPYSNADFADVSPTPGVQARTVGSGMRIRYIGPELARSGQIVGVRHPDNETLVGLSYNDIRSYSTAKTYNNSRQWIYVMWRPVQPNEYHFSRNSSTASDGNLVKWETGFVIQGTTDTSGAPGPAPFEWETVHYTEYIGNIDNVTRSHVDLVGMSHIRNALPTKSTTDKPHHNFAITVKKVEDSIGESLPAAAGGALAYRNFASGAEAAEATEGSSVFSALYDGAAQLAAKGAGFLEDLAPLAEGLGAIAMA